MAPNPYLEAPAEMIITNIPEPPRTFPSLVELLGALERLNKRRVRLDGMQAHLRLYADGSGRVQDHPDFRTAKVLAIFMDIREAIPLIDAVPATGQPSEGAKR